MVRLTARVAVLVLLSAGMLGAASPEASVGNKKPWDWTLAQRLAVRLDPAQIVERQRQAELEDERGQHALGTQRKPVPRERVDNYSVDGRQHPELLLPHELFDGLMTGFVPDEERQARQRKNFRAAIVAAGFDEQLFWAQLSSAASEYVAYKYKEADRSIQSTQRRDPERGCRLAFDALTAARQVFGPERFDQFLYQGIAPLTQVASATTAADPAAELRRRAAGCR